MSNNRDKITLSMDELAELVSRATQAALAGMASPKVTGKPKATLAEAKASGVKADAYLARQVENATSRTRKDGVQRFVTQKYSVRRQKNQYLIFTEGQFADARRKGLNPETTFGKRVFSTFENGHRAYMSSGS